MDKQTLLRAIETNNANWILELLISSFKTVSLDKIRLLAKELDIKMEEPLMNTEIWYLIDNKIISFMGESSQLKHITIYDHTDSILSEASYIIINKTNLRGNSNV